MTSAGPVMRERPILFSTPMVRAILAGEKTQTRRVACKGTIPAQYVSAVQYEPGRWRLFDAENAPASRAQYTMPPCPYGQPGDRLWVRETWAQPDRRSAGFPPWIYAADHLERPAHRWRPSIHMPRAASRITLEVTGVRVERLQDISEADAQAEGVHAVQCNDLGTEVPYYRSLYEPRDLYRMLWESINGPGSWAANPWVWVVEFKRLESTQ